MSVVTSSAAPIPEKDLPLSYARTLSWLSFVVILLTSLGLSFFISTSARQTLLTKQEEFARLLADNLNHQIFRRFALPTILAHGRIALRQSSQYEHLSEVVGSVIHGLPVERLRIYDFSRLVAFSTNKEDLGRTGLAPEGLEKVLRLSPDIVLLDIRMPGMNGMQLHKRLLEEGNDLPVLFLTGHGDIDMAVTALKRGAGDFLQKPSDPEKLQTVVRRLVDENINARKRKADIAQKRRKYDLLTQREKDVVNLVCQGELNKVIADKLGITLFTVKIHRANACRKLECRSAVEISDFLRDIGLKDGKNDVRGS